MSWITVDTKLGNHPKMAALPNDAARYGWILTLLEAKEQAKAGTFATAKHYRLVMGRHGRFLEDYIKARLIDKDEDGSLHVHDWRRHQWSVAKATQRETSGGHSEDISETSEGQKEDASRAVLVPVYVSSSSTEGVQGEPNAWDAFHRRTGEVPGPKIRSWLDELGDAHGEARLVAMIGETPMAGTVPEYLKAVRDRLRLEDMDAERIERQDEARRNEAKRAPLKILPSADDITPEEARRQAEEYIAASRSER